MDDRETDYIVNMSLFDNSLYQDMSFQGKYTPPQIGADVVATLLDNKKEAAILDAATGTGLVGMHVR